MAPTFTGSAGHTLGVEVEATIIDIESGLPSPLAPQVAQVADAIAARGSVTTDQYASTLELITGICDDVAQVRDDLLGTWAAVRPALDERGAALLAMGVHPTAAPSDFAVSDGDRSRMLDAHLRWPVRQLFTTGIHVHIGMPDGDAAVRTAGTIAGQLPILIALAAASPCLGGEITGLASTRMNLFDAVPRSGVMPMASSWEDWSTMMNAIGRGDALNDWRDCWWDVRPRPHLGTLEIRVFDTVPDLDHVLACVALAQCLAVQGLRNPESAQRYEILVENRWRAVRDGLDATLVTEAGARSVRECAADLIDVVSPIADELGCGAELEVAAGLIAGPSLAEQWAPVAEVEGPSALIDRATMRW